MINNIDDKFVHLGKDVFIGNNVVFDKIQKENEQGIFKLVIIVPYMIIVDFLYLMQSLMLVIMEQFIIILF